MGNHVMIELRGGRTSIRISPTVWTMTLELARLAGWQPVGPQRSASVSQPLMLSWLIQYNTSDGQTVGGEDAASLAAALECAAESGEQILNDYQSGKLRLDVPLRTPA